MNPVLLLINKQQKATACFGKPLRGDQMIKSNTLSTTVQHRIESFINDRIADNLSRKDAIEVLAEYIELKAGEKISSKQLRRWIYDDVAVPAAKLIAITNAF